MTERYTTPKVQSINLCRILVKIKVDNNTTSSKLKHMKNVPDIKSLPQPPKDATFSLQEVTKVSFPHPYCITPKHVAWAADHFSGMLSADAIRAAEKNGACCDTCRRKGSGILPYDEHESSVTLFVKVPQNKDLNAIEGLHSYLFNNKAKFIEAGVEGFAFPTK